MTTNGRGAIRRDIHARFLVSLLCISLATSCVTTWDEYPHPAAEAHPAASPETLYYAIEDVRGMFGGGDAVRGAFPKLSPFSRTEPLAAPPEHGIFCRVTSERRAPSVASGVAAYVSYALLFLIPFWSNEGYVVRYQVFIDGEEKKIFEYPIARKAFVWLLALPVSWVSLLTPSERDAFEATAKQFFVDVVPYVDGKEPWPTAKSKPAS